MRKKIEIDECFNCPYRDSKPAISTVICTYKEDKILKNMDWSPIKLNDTTFVSCSFPKDCPLENA